MGLVLDMSRGRGGFLRYDPCGLVNRGSCHPSIYLCQHEIDRASKCLSRWEAQIYHDTRWTRLLWEVLCLREARAHILQARVCQLGKLVGFGAGAGCWRADDHAETL